MELGAASFTVNGVLSKVVNKEGPVLLLFAGLLLLDLFHTYVTGEPLISLTGMRLPDLSTRSLICYLGVFFTAAPILQAVRKIIQLGGLAIPNALSNLFGTDIPTKEGFVTCDELISYAAATNNQVLYGHATKIREEARRLESTQENLFFLLTLFSLESISPIGSSLQTAINYLELYGANGMAIRALAFLATVILFHVSIVYRVDLEYTYVPEVYEDICAWRAQQTEARDRRWRTLELEPMSTAVGLGAVGESDLPLQEELAYRQFRP